MNNITPIFRITGSLMLITISLLFAADLLGLTPDPSKAILDQRKKVCESLAVQFSGAAQLNQFGLIELTLKSVVERNEDMLSSAIRLADGGTLVKAGDHSRHWQGADATRSTPTHVRVPIFRDGSTWGTVEISFTPLQPTGIFGISMSPLTQLVIFIGLACFLSFLVLMKKVLRHLDPASIIPGRVQLALDALASGIVIMDDKERVILANAAFTKATGRSMSSLLGRRISKMGWLDAESDRKLKNTPWVETIEDGLARNGVTLKFSAPGMGGQTYNVNNSPILDGDDQVRGVMVSFEDITEIQETNVQMKHTLTDLEDSQVKIDQQNKKLQVLATRDSLTGCLNRRAFFEQFEAVFQKAVEGESELSYIMVDIDHFKSINDRFGHLTGDQVIKSVVKSMEAVSRQGDLVCRYGGEEFCLLLPTANLIQANTIAERLRFAIRKDSGAKFKQEIMVTASLGVASIKSGAESPTELVSQADRALYVAKNSGRNRVQQWSDDCEEKASESEIDMDSGQASLVAGRPDASSPAKAPDEEMLKQLYGRIMDLEGTLAEQTQETQHMLAYDGLTGLPNRGVFHDRISQAIAGAKRDGKMIAVVSLDTNMFKRVNDTLGDAIGDSLLIAVGDRLERSLREIDTVAILGADNAKPAVSRISGDEFGILVSGLESTEPVTCILNRITDMLLEVFKVDGHEIYLNSRMGISMYPIDGEGVDALVRKASLARFMTMDDTDDSKYQFYSDELNDIAIRHIELENHLRRALDNDEFLLNYQPKVDLHTGQVIAMEALIRWQNPDHGLVPPDEFIPAAERTGVIIDLGAWVTRTACAQLKQWHKEGFTDLRMAVNVSARQLRQKDFVGQIETVLREFNLQPRHLEIEVTERAVVDCVDNSSSVIGELYKLGIRVSIDDFGTGYSALNYLKKFPVDTLKIDRAFIQNIVKDEHDRSIVIAIIEMARNLDIVVLAEGVEDENQLELLTRLHCDEVQGFLFSRPVSVPEATDFLKNTAVADGAFTLLSEYELPSKKAV